MAISVQRDAHWPSTLGLANLWQCLKAQRDELGMFGVLWLHVTPRPASSPE